MPMMDSRTHTATTTATATPMRPGTPESSPFADSIAPVPRANPFASPFTSGPASTNASSSALHQQVLNQRYFHSRRVRKGEVERPWMDKKDPREKWVTIIPLIGLFLGFAIAGFLIYDGLKTVVNHVYCPVLNEDFSGGFNSKIWTKEAEVGGFGYALSVGTFSPILIEVQKWPIRTNDHHRRECLRSERDAAYQTDSSRC